MTHLVVTNITRDQPARNGSPDLIYDAIFHAIDENTTLILNADDPGLMRIKLTFPGEIITYGVNKTRDSYLKKENFSVDNAYCPNCHKKLIYSYYHYGHIGSYYCPNCDFKRGNPNFVAKNVDLKKGIFEINQNSIHLNRNFLFTVYATTAAYALTKTIGVKEKDILYALNKDITPSKRGKELKMNDRPVMMLESKNENALSYYQSLKYIANADGKKTVVLGFDNVSRRYKYNDLSWLWDVEFELLNEESITNIVLIGRFKWDVRVRLKYARIPDKKIIMLEDINEFGNVISKETKGNIYTMVCFDMTEILLHKIKEYQDGNN